MHRYSNLIGMAGVLLLCSAAFAAEPTAPAVPGDPAAATAAPTVASPTPAIAATGAEEYARRLKALRSELVAINEHIKTLESRIRTLESTAVSDPSETGHVVLIHRNEMGDAFVLESVRYLLEDASIFSRIDPGAELDNKKEFEIFNGRLRPGRYSISVSMVYRGHGYGVYSYLKGYRFKIRSSYVFEAVRGKRTCLKIVAYERETDSEDLTDRPQVRYDASPACKVDPFGGMSSDKKSSIKSSKGK